MLVSARAQLLSRSVRAPLMRSNRLVIAALIAGQQTRGFNWDPRLWGQTVESRGSIPKLEDELPEIFASQPAEFDDYISPEKSTFERLEDFWDWAVGFMQPVEKQIDIMRSLRHDGLFGFNSFESWGHVLLFYGAILRFLTLAASLYSHRNALRMNQIGPKLSEITSQQNKARNDSTLSTAEKRIVKEGYSRLKSALMKKHKCSQWKTFATMLTAPVTMSAFLSVRRLALYEEDLQAVPFLWVTDLTLPDPTYALPAVCVTMFLGNFELNQRMQRGGRSSSSIYIRWGMRAGATVGFYFIAQLPAAMFVYWIGLSMVGLLQPILLRWQPFRNFFDFPDPPQAARQRIVSKIKGPTLYERFLVSKEEKLRRERERRAQHDLLSKRKFETIDDYEVIFEPTPAKPSSKPVFGFKQKK
ncbi:unnamed protein product [Phytomonas sp. EM1]|nr:unnamed protein product [Phytomonas sp. EM1]|eukprot:CCW63520.1 unnamed protein product [Phytomonas sp. isolate EM1]